MANILRFIGIFVVLIVASMLILAVGGVLSSTELWHNVVKVLEVAGIVLGGSVLVTFIAKKLLPLSACRAGLDKLSPIC